MVQVQYTKILVDKMKHNPDWDTSRINYDPLKFMAFIEKIIWALTEYQYPFATVNKQEVAFYIFDQPNLTNDQWYDRFNNKVDIGSVIGVTR